MDKVASSFSVLTLVAALNAMLVQPWAVALLAVLVPITATLWTIVLLQAMFS